MRKRILHVLTLIPLALMLTLHSCGAIERTKDDLLGAVDDALERLQVESNNWQRVLRDLISQVDKTAHETIHADLQSLLNRSIASVGVEARCGTDFIGNRVAQELQRLRDILLGNPPQMTEVPPSICNLDPAAVELGLDPSRRAALILYGYDVSNANLEVTLLETTGATKVTQHLSVSSPYQMTLNLGSNGVPLTKNSQKLIFSWKGKDISVVPVVQPNVPPCKTRSQDFIPNDVDFTANTLLTPTSPDFTPLVVGASTLDVLRPIDVSGTVKLAPKGRQFYVTVNMTASAAEKRVTVTFPYMTSKRIDPTTITGTQTLYAGSVDAGWNIIGVSWPEDTNGFSYQRFRTPGKDDEFDAGPQQFVKKWYFHIDKGGPDAGYTGVRIQFRPMILSLQEDNSDGHCTTQRP